MSNRIPPRKRNLPPYYERVMRIVHEHILYARRHPDRLLDIATRMTISPDSALALAIADQVCEEFSLTQLN